MQSELGLDESAAGEAGAVVGVLAAVLPVQGQRLQVCWQKLAIHASPHLPQAACSRAHGSFACVLNRIPCPTPERGIKQKKVLFSPAPTC